MQLNAMQLNARQPYSLVWLSRPRALLGIDVPNMDTLVAACPNMAQHIREHKIDLNHDTEHLVITYQCYLELSRALINDMKFDIEAIVDSAGAEPVDMKAQIAALMEKVRDKAERI